MFSQELENLIQATLEDGVLEDFEKAALVKRAQAEGVDLTELEIYINSILQKRKRELELEKAARFEQKAQEKKEAFGRVCPNCGKQIPPMTLKCECGYEFNSTNSSSIVQQLMDKIEQIQSAPINNSISKEEMANRRKRIRDTISVFPVPNTKEDIIEFLSLAVSNSKIKGGLLGTVKGRLTIAVPIAIVSLIVVCIAMVALFGSGRDGSVGAGLVIGLLYGAAAAVGVIFACLKLGTEMIEDNKTASVWRDKFDQILLKGRSLRGDPEFQKQLDYYENMVNRQS